MWLIRDDWELKCGQNSCNAVGREQLFTELYWIVYLTTSMIHSSQLSFSDVHRLMTCHGNQVTRPTAGPNRLIDSSLLHTSCHCTDISEAYQVYCHILHQ